MLNSGHQFQQDAAPAPQAGAQEPLDLAALGRTWEPLPESETTPEIADLLTEMPAWAARGLVYLIVAFIVAALSWAHFSVIDIIVSARGNLVPEGYVRPMQAPVGGVVQRVFVREGEMVERGRLIAQLDTSELHARLNKLREELSASREQARQLRALKGPVVETLESENRLARLQSEISATERSLNLTAITAPASGIITALDVRGAGVVVAAGQRLAAIAPADARLVVEARALNKDVALLRPGQPVKLKFDAFPAQDYGAVSGTIVEVSPDAQSEDGQGSFYKVTILPQQTENASPGGAVRLRHGLTATAEIVTERRTILNLLIAPFRKIKGEMSSAN